MAKRKFQASEFGRFQSVRFLHLSAFKLNIFAFLITSRFFHACITSSKNLDKEIVAQICEMNVLLK